MTHNKRSTVLFNIVPCLCCISGAVAWGRGASNLFLLLSVEAGLMSLLHLYPCAAIPRLILS